VQHHHPKGPLFTLALLDQIEVAHLENLQGQVALRKQAVGQRKQFEFSQLWLRTP
jgi:hypothetical protein